MEIKKVLSQKPSMSLKEDSSDEDMMSDIPTPSVTSAKGSRAGRARGANRGRGTGRSTRGNSTATKNNTMESFISVSKRKRFVLQPRYKWLTLLQK